MDSLQAVLVPIDFSEAALNALETAATLAKARGAVLRLLHVFDTSLDFLQSGAAATDSPERIVPVQDVMQVMASRILKNHGFLPEVHFLEGPVAASIIKAAWLYSADLIVMGTHGASGIREGYAGATTYQVVKHAPCSVLTIPPHKKTRHFQRALLPVRPSGTALAAYPFMRQLLQPATGQVELLPITGRGIPQSQHLLLKMIAAVNSRFPDDQLKTAPAADESPEPAAAILRATEQVGCDLVILTGSVDAVTKPNYIGPHTQHILHRARVPVLHMKEAGVPVAL